MSLPSTTAQPKNTHQSYSLIGDKVLRIAHAPVVDDKLPEVPASVVNDGIKAAEVFTLALVLVAGFAWRALVLCRVPRLVDVGLPQENPHQDHLFVPTSSVGLVI